MKKNLILIIGPTGIGKTKLSIEIAKKVKTEIISADSRQIYQKLDIGTAKPSLLEQENIKHHLLDLVPINQLYTTGDFVKDASLICKDLLEKNNSVIMTGGTGLYIDAFCNGLDNMPKTDTKIRNNLNLEYKTNGLKNLLVELKHKDEEYYKAVDTNNFQRIIRALEICRITNKPYSHFRQKKSKKNDKYNFIKIGLLTDREKLYENINKRVDNMIEKGLVDEVKSLIKYKSYNALKTIGYKEIFDFLEGRINLPSGIDLIKRNSRRYAKRQITWFKRDKEIRWFHPKEKNNIHKYLSSKI